MENGADLERPNTANISIPLLPMRSIDISQQGHKAEIHVQLLMPMKQREPRIVGQEIDFDRFAAWNDDYIFEDPSRGGTCKPRQPKDVAMQMHGVIVIPLIAKEKAVPGIR